MIDALCHGKLSREQENLEDLLTSMVFGCLRHTPPAEGVLPWLRLARTLNDDQPLEKVDTASEVTYEFWPRWQEPGCSFCEPDVVLALDNSDKERWLVCIEAKFNSGKSGEGDECTTVPDDQLAKQWDNLVCIAAKANWQPLLIYLTAGFGIPTADIQFSIQHFQKKRPSASLPTIAWLSWRQLPTLFAENRSSLLAELPRLCARLDLTDYSGIGRIESVSLNWKFAVPFNWLVVPPAPLQWKFSHE